ncbi:hypothetical protein [Chryseobacterium koreense]|uniref:Uncharacterized protein n=1 Tax=Chryseobacterium koreense CCUG 49689 TaxID=1304281 RepID=A0A0J7IXC8_9FLAO|nr:hypothetical protein [Chryseobacterium koreense]KMQ70474.1 hypothetical protein ACM44_12240 [Chryseobacterium koreense CCUG 49689]MBB5334463.1 hypothetical protein [Chryseobacterium koreense]
MKKLTFRFADYKFLYDENGAKIIKNAKGDTIRSSLYKDTFLAKIRDVERYNNGQPKRNNQNEWEYKKGDEKFLFAVRKPIKDVLSKIDDIIDPVIKKLVIEQKDNNEIKDHQGNIIRHVRIKTKAGREVKKRVNYISQYDYKNKYYAASDEIPYALLLQKTINNELQKVMFPVPSFETSKHYRKFKNFKTEDFIENNYPEFIDWSFTLLKVGQKLLVLNNDNEYERKNEIDFQQKRLYVITQFSDGSIWLKYHLEAIKDDDIDRKVKLKKDEIISEFDKKFNLPEIVLDYDITDPLQRKKKYEDDKFRFVGLKDNRFNRLIPFMGSDEVQKLKRSLDGFKKQSSFIEKEGETPLLKMSKEKWNFLFEGEDFEISLDGKIFWKF